MKRLLAIAILMLSLGLAPGVYATSSMGEYQVKAAYLYNFIKFIYWPEKVFKTPHSPLVIGILGVNNFDNKLESLQGKKIGQRSININYFATLKDVHDCHLLYISKSESPEIQEILDKLAIRPIVTVGESKQFVDLGGTIQFVTRRGRLRFLINQKSAQNNYIQIDAQLLSLAIRVIEEDK